ncbi:MAG TPA: hydroxyacid dehydrogenase, partial [Phycisphaerae bacterium]|nr:hydroxyacid dehydrogenase [Phycisphaerae bacterium]
MNKIKMLVADKLSKVGIEWLEAQDDVEVTVKAGLPPEELAKIVGEYDGMIIRSGVKVTADVLASPGRLKGIARAGVGVDNVDVPVATAKGIIVMNTPGGNMLATAELTMTLMLALSRKISPANASLKAGKWDRKSFEGTQLSGKTLGVVGMGRIGKAVASRAAAFEMRVLGFDPFFAGGEGMNVEMVKDINELCKRADYITVHVPKSAETLGMIGAEQFAVMKPTCRLLNAARGGIIDPKALLDALNAGKVAGAALDVWTKEPPESEAEKALIQHEKVLGVPHLGASTEEAQEQVALEAAQQLVEALRGGEVRNAVNAPGFDKALPASVRP